MAQLRRLRQEGRWFKPPWANIIPTSQPPYFHLWAERGDVAASTSFPVLFSVLETVSPEAQLPLTFLRSWRWSWLPDTPASPSCMLGFPSHATTLGVTTSQSKDISRMFQVFESTYLSTLSWKRTTQGSEHSFALKEHESAALYLPCVGSWSARYMECKGKYSLANYMGRIAAKRSADDHIISQSSTKSEDRSPFTVVFLVR